MPILAVLPAARTGWQYCRLWPWRCWFWRSAFIFLLNLPADARSCPRSGGEYRAGIATPRWTYGQAVPRNQIPLLEIDEFRHSIFEQVADGGRVVALFGQPAERDFVRNCWPYWHLPTLIGCRWCRQQCELHTPALTPHCPQVHWFEREIAEQWGVTPVGHPWLKPIRFHHAYRPGRDVWNRAENAPIEPCVTDYFRVEGEEVHEVAIGPVHAGVIEPGHFRFQCHGEKVFHLEISLGYQHRGIERA